MVVVTASRSILAYVGVLLVIVGCAGAPRPETEVLDRSPRIAEVFRQGLAIAPTAHLQPVAGSAKIAARFSNSLHIEAMTQFRGIDILSPEYVLESLGRGGETALEDFRQMRRRLVRGNSPDVAALARIADLLSHPFLLVTWADEEERYGMEDLPTDYTESGFANDVRRAKFGRVEGDLIGVVLDLEGAEILWRGKAHYESEKDFGVTGNGKADLADQARIGAAYDLVGLLLEQP